MNKKSDLLQGTMDLLILQTLVAEPMHGYGISQRIEQITKGVFRINAGTLFPSLYRLEERGFIAGSWQPSENNRRAKYYGLTKAGRKQLEAEKTYWDVVSLAIKRVLES